MMMNVLVIQTFFFEKEELLQYTRKEFFFRNKERNEFFYILRNKDLEQVLILYNERGIE